MAISTSHCPNFTGEGHDNSRLPFVPWQLHGAHLHPLRRLGSDLEKVPAPSKWGEYEGGLKSTDKRYGVCLTRSRLFVLDIDTHNGVDGNRTLAKVLAKLGLTLDTFTVATGTGGFHYYFQLPVALADAGIKKSVNLWPGVDVFPVGQQVVGPGSTRTMEDGSTGRYEVSNDAPIAKMPKKLTAAILKKIARAGDARRKERKERAGNTSANLGTYSPRLGGDLSPKQEQVLASMCEELSGALAGSRHATILRVAFSAGAFFGPDARLTVFPEIQAAAIASGHDESCAASDAEGAFDAGTAEWTPYVPETPVEVDSTKAKGEKPELPKLNGKFFTDGGVARSYQDAREGQLVSVDEWNSWARFSPESGAWRKTNSSVITSDLLDWFTDGVYPALEKKLRAEAKKVKGDEAASKEQKRKAAKLLGRAGSYLNRVPCQNAVGVAFGRLMRQATLFDANPDVLNINGTAIDLRTTRLRPAVASDYFTLSGSSAVEVDPEFKSELFELILEAFLPETREYMQVLMGSALTGHQPKPAGLFFLQADGDNGKSTFADVFKAMLGQYADLLDSEILLDSQGSKTFSKIRIKGKRFIIIEELPKKGQLDAKASKEMAGTEQMTGAHKGVDEETFDLQATFLINTNYKLRVSETDRGTKKRLKLIPMPFTFLPQDEYEAKVALWKAGKGKSPDELKIKPQDPRLDEAKKNPEVLKAALAWALEGARKFYANGKRVLPETPAMKAAKTEWLASQDRISLWWEEYIVEDPNAFCLVLDLHESYEQSVLAGGSSQRPEAQRQFMEMLKAHDNFKAAGAEHFQNMRVPAHLRDEQSLWTPEKKDHWDNPVERRRIAKDKASFITGIRFKAEADFAAEAEAEDSDRSDSTQSPVPDSSEADIINDLEEIFG